jgi:DNA-directed RNA polymerase
MVAAYLENSVADVKRYQAGRARLAALQEIKGLGPGLKRSAAAAQNEPRWDQVTRLRVGAFLLSLLCENAYLPDGMPGSRRPKNLSAAAAAGGGSAAAAAAAAGPAAFEYIYLRRGLRQQAHVRASEALVRVMLADKDPVGVGLLHKVPPMLVPPLPWSSYATGGQLTSRCGFGGRGGECVCGQAEGVCVF